MRQKQEAFWGQVQYVLGWIMFLFQMFIFCVLYNFTLIWTLKYFINISFTLIIEFFGTALNFVSLQVPLLPHCCASPVVPHWSQLF